MGKLNNKMIKSLDNNYDIVYRTKEEALLEHIGNGKRLKVLASGKVYINDKEVTSKWKDNTRAIVRIQEDNRPTSVCRSTLVMYAFGTFDFKENKLTVVNHKDNNSLNDSIDNLETCTASENLIHGHAYKTLLSRGFIRNGYKLSAAKAKELLPYLKDLRLKGDSLEKEYKRVVASYNILRELGTIV